jgi:hypothetical protein
MKKQEIIHLHGLANLVHDGLADGHDNIPEHEDFDSFSPRLNNLPGYLEEYGRIETYPTSIHMSKNDHKEAVLELSSTVAERLENDPFDPDDLDPVDQRLALEEDRKYAEETMRQIYGSGDNLIENGGYQQGSSDNRLASD